MYSIGLDVGKSSIAVHIPKSKLDIEIENNIKSLKSLYSKLKKIYKKEVAELVFVFEPTGNYSSVLHRFCAGKNIKIFMVNPKQSRNFAKAIAQRNKSDKIDAKVLSEAIVIAREDEVIVPVINPLVEEIKELISYYKLKLKQRVQLSNHLESLDFKQGNKSLIKRVKNEISQLKKIEESIIDEIYELMIKDVTLKNKYNAIISIDGIGKIAALMLLHLFIKYPNANQRQIISLVGLDPIIKESGTSVKGRSRISKAGGALYRGTLFMPTMSAIRYNEKMKLFYARLKIKGKHTTVAQIAVMRKLVTIAYSLYKSEELYNKTKYLNC